MLRVVTKSAIIVIASAVLALAVNAVSPNSIPLRPQTRPTDRPPRNGALTAEPSASYLTIEDFRIAVELQLATVIDARDPNEFAKGHVPGAINLPVTAFAQGRPAALDRIAPDADIIVYCDGKDCGSSAIVAEQLRLYRFQLVRVYVGGFPDWEAAGLEVAYGA